MLGLRSDILKSTAFAPRAHLEGIDLPSTFQLPSLPDVQKDIVELARIRRSGGPEEIQSVFMTSQGASPGGRGELMSEPLRYNFLFPHLFRFSYFANTADVPESMLEDAIFALKMFIRVMEESSEQQLRGMGHILKNQTLELGRYFIVSNARYKLCTHLLKPVIDRPAEALPYLKASVETDIERNEKRNKTPWVENPFLYSLYSDALVWTGAYTEAKPILEHILEAAEGPDMINITTAIMRAHIHLSFVLQQLDIEPDAQKEHTEWAAKFLRKNPKIVAEATLSQILSRKGQISHPVLLALGGTDWLHERRNTARADERLAKQCRNCSVREMQKPLFRCSQCQHIWYCSKECQKANWKHHKISCKETALAKERAERLKAIDPSEAQKAADWNEWRNLPHAANTYALAHALGVRRDPSRGRTHIVFRQVEWAPRAKDPRYKFRIKGAGVYRIADVLTDIETMMGLDPGEGKEYIDSLLDELDATGRHSEKVPILDITIGDGIQTWMGSSAITLDRLRNVPYDPNWRKIMNKGAAAGNLRLKSGAPDAENVF